MEADPLFTEYWKRKQLLQGQVPHFPVKRWWPTEGLCDIERVFFERLQGARTLLDVGAGDLRVKRKLEAAGFRGEYHTQDVSDAYPYTFRDLSQATGPYDAVLCLDVIEHLSLREGLSLLQRLGGLLSERGVLIVQTPNARCVRSPLASDMTHTHIYNLPDLWAFLTAQGLSVEGFRVAFGPEHPSLKERAHGLLARAVTTRLLGLDYADNIALVARRG